MKTLGKYRFGSKGAATTKINALGIDDEGNPTHSHLIVHLGHPIETEAVFDADGVEVSAAVYSNDYLVDVLWDGEANEDWESAFVYTASPKHMLGASGVQAQYIARVKAERPELFPEPEIEETEGEDVL